MFLAALLFVAVPTTGPRHLTADDLRDYSWRSVGPANMGGRCSDMCFVPGHPKIFFAAFGTSGLWKTTNLGTTFVPVFDNYNVNSIGSVVAMNAPTNWAGWKADKNAPKDEKEREKAGIGKIVWVGTGEGNGRNSSSYGDGVYRSTDGGASFTNVGLKDSKDIPRLAVDPRNPDVCYAAALGHLWGPNKERGIYKTTDGGKTWKAELQVDDQTGAVDVLLDPAHPDTVYAAMYHRYRTAYSFESGSETGGIFKSNDGGNHWNKLTAGLPKETGRIGLTISPKNPNHLWAVVESHEGGPRNLFDNRSRTGGLFESTNGGATWTRINALDPRAFYFSKIRVDPNDDQKLYMIGFEFWFSEDGGHSFQTGRGGVNHGDWHALTIDPADSDHLIAGTDGGIYQSFDQGVTWDFMCQMAVGEFYNLALDRSTPYRLLGGLQDNGSWLGPSADPFGQIVTGDWASVGGGDGFHVDFDPTDPNVVYTESQGGALGRINIKTGAYRGLAPEAQEGQPSYRFNWNTPFFVSPHDPSVLYMGGNRVFRLTNRGDNNEPVSPDLSKQIPDRIVTAGSSAENHGTVVALTESTLKKGLLWAGTDDGRVHVTDEPGVKNWHDVTPREVNGLYIANIDAGHSDANVAVMAVDGHRSDVYDPIVLRTTNHGRTWTNISGDLPKGFPVRVVKEDLKSSNVLYAGTENGIYITTDTGAHWLKFNLGSLPTVGVHDIVQHPDTGDIAVATHGRSLWILDNASAFSQLTAKVMDSPLYLFENRAGKPGTGMGRDGLWGNKIYSAQNPSSLPVITYWLRDAGNGVNLKIENDKGVTVATLSGGGSAGLNRVTWYMQRDGNKMLANHGEDSFNLPAGTYKVTATQDDGKGGMRTSTGSITILPYPVNVDLPVGPVSKGGKESEND